MNFSRVIFFQQINDCNIFLKEFCKNYSYRESKKKREIPVFTKIHKSFDNFIEKYV